MVNLGGEKAECLDLTVTDNDTYNRLTTHIKTELLNVLEWHVTHTAFAHTMLPVIGTFLEELDINRYAFLVRGLTGSGKSHLMINMQRFFSPTYTNPISWTSTHNVLQRIGFFFKDATFLIDDLKKRNIEKTYAGVLALLQNYADGSTRDRMKNDTSMQRSYNIRGWLSMTGEDTIEYEASNLARMITVRTMNKDKKMDIGASMEEWSPLYSAFTARYINHILKIDKNEIKSKFKNYKSNVFYPKVCGMTNDVRMAQNIAQLMTSYEYAMKFLYADEPKEGEKNIATMIDLLEGLTDKLVKEAGEESASQIFWGTLLDLLAREEVYLQEGNTLPSDKPFAGSKMVGFKGQRDSKTYFLPSFFDTVQRHLRLTDRMIGHSRKAVMDELVDLGLLESAQTVVRKFNGKNRRVYSASDLALEEF